MFDLNDLDVLAENPQVVLHYKGKLEECEEDDPDRDGTISFWLRYLTGKDDRAITDAMMVSNRQGATKWQTGKVNMMKVVRAVVKMEGVGVGTTPAGKMTERIYDMLPQWIIEALRLKIQEMNVEEVEDEGE